MKCSEFTEGIVEIAFGSDSAASSEHVRNCARCAAILSQMRRIARGIGYGSYAAPQQVIDRAAGLSLPRSVPLVLLRSTLEAAGARGAGAGSFQRVFRASDSEIRVMYSRNDDRWSVMVRTGIENSIEPDEDTEVIGERGAYEFNADSLDRTGFWFHTPSAGARIPPGSAALENGERP